MTDRGRVLDLVLDAVDPRIDSEARLSATEEAAELDIRLAYTLARGAAYGLLNFVRERHGDEALASVIGQIAHTSMVVLDHHHSEEDDHA